MVRTGRSYINSINKLQTQIWYDGKKVTGNISEHPAFKGVMQSQAALYDLQAKHEQDMTFDSDLTGNKVGLSYLIPKTKEDLAQRRNMIQRWAKASGGVMGRSPDYMNTVLAAFASSVDLLKGGKNCYPDRLLKFYEYASKQDLSFTHTFINPQVNRSFLSVLNGEDTTKAKVVDRTAEGLVINGAKLLATQGGITDEIIVFSTPGVEGEDYAYSFAIPSDAKGLSFMCRESFAYRESSFDHPLSSRFEEMDTVVIFDQVQVPWERVFFYDNIMMATDFYVKSNFVPLTLHQIVSRQVVKLEFLLGIVLSIIDAISIQEYQHVQSKVSEVIKGLETIRALLLHAEHAAEQNKAGVMVPDRQKLYVALNFFQEQYPRYAEIITILGASGMVSIPAESDFSASMGDKLDHYLQSSTKQGKDRVRLFRLAWDLSMSAFGSRQTLYERFFFGDPVRISRTIFNTFPKDRYIEEVNQFLHKKS
ncbi:4-hydroxyphenylacetate 3-monooxygenase, oxygenase component [Thalassobacillus sp. CUG 92003]|uniref:4-hydroxyphenylacetate 3-monooxygenase, oxygenase component n=1 Tax=Thalassobacillus sp. CUG 92003 TaxID=2736641 RepID=UPI00351A746B